MSSSEGLDSGDILFMLAFTFLILIIGVILGAGSKEGVTINKIKKWSIEQGYSTYNEKTGELEHHDEDVIAILNLIENEE